MFRDAATGKQKLKLEGHGDWLRTVCYSGDGARIATASRDGTARVWDAATGKAVLACSGHAGPVVAAVLSKDGKMLVTAGEDGDARVWAVGE